MTFLLDPLLLIALGAGIALLDRHIPSFSKKFTLVLTIITLTIFWIVGSLFYLDYLSIPWIGDAGRGRHFMWNSGIELIGLKPPIDVSATYTDPLNKLNIAAILLFTSYPIFLYLGIHICKTLMERRHRTCFSKHSFN
ncbi:MAG: hypothetical protein LZ173_01850 [Thaumarchaeota archaeon]|jgi:hypothetical protein|nr:hypothetical protein [Candidatus Geocrenenecus arthurdayi]